MGIRYKFLFFHPYLTYNSNQNIEHFINPDGNAAIDHDRYDLSSLWLLGKDAYSYFIGVESKEDFDEIHKSYLNMIDSFRDLIKDRNDINFVSADTGLEIKPDVEDISEYDVLRCIKGLFERNNETEITEDINGMLKECLLLCCLSYIDSALLSGVFDRFGGTHYIIEATKAFYEYKALEISGDVGKKERVKLAIKAANASHSENRALKKDVFEWYLKNRHNYKSMEEAAAAATKIVPMTHRTVREWIAEC